MCQLRSYANNRRHNSRGGDPLRARKTLPKCLYIVKSSKHGLGVFAKEQLKVAIQFGPYEGVRKEVGDPDLDSGFAFDVSIY